jgi:hypothetical protein
METRDYMFLIAAYRGEYSRLTYFKNTGKGINVGEGFINNSGPTFFPRRVTEDGKAFQSFSIYAYKVELEKKGTSLDKLDPKLQTLIHNSKFDDNPCIMLVTLK